MTQPKPLATATIDTLYQDIRQLIEAAKTHMATQVNQALVLTYWQIGKTIKTKLLQDARSEYGLATLKQLAQQLQQEYGAGFSYSSLTRIIKFYSYHPEQAIVATQLSGSHFSAWTACPMSAQPYPNKPMRIMRGSPHE
ncbi:MAG: hypothetical protein HOO93_14785 [Methyloglobulus sp.]|nr:hypothetical protein [Methyloglobulus sp.]